MDLFYKATTPAAPVTSGGAQHLSAAAARFAVSIVRSIPQLPEAAWVEFQRLLTVDALWSLCLILAGWVLATVVGGFIGLAVNALLIVYGLVELWEQIQDVGHALRQWAVTAYEATTDGARHRSAALRNGAGAGGLTILEVLVTHRVFRAVEASSASAFPSPAGSGKQYEQAAAQREQTAGREPGAALRKVRRSVEKLADVTAAACAEGSSGSPKTSTAAGGALWGLPGRRNRNGRLGRLRQRTQGAAMKRQTDSGEGWLVGAVLGARRSLAGPAHPGGLASHARSQGRAGPRCPQTGGRASRATPRPMSKRRRVLASENARGQSRPCTLSSSTRSCAPRKPGQDLFDRITAGSGWGPQGERKTGVACVRSRLRARRPPCGSWREVLEGLHPSTLPTAQVFEPVQQGSRLGCGDKGT